jgi:hypothetical protein
VGDGVGSLGGVVTTLTDHPQLFRDPGDVTSPIPGGVRRTDPQTSRDVANDPALRVAWQSERHRLLVAFDSDEAASVDGLTDERAAEIANRTGRYIDPTHESTRRCSEMLKDGLLELTGEKRPKKSGRASRVKRITSAGRLALREVRS